MLTKVKIRKIPRFCWFSVFFSLFTFCFLFFFPSSFSFAQESSTIVIDLRGTSVFPSKEEPSSESSPVSEPSSDTQVVNIQLQEQSSDEISEDQISRSMEEESRKIDGQKLSLDEIHLNIEALKEDLTSQLYSRGYTQLEGQIQQRVNEFLEKHVESKYTPQQDRELDLLYQIVDIEKAKLDARISKEGLDEVLYSVKSSRSMSESQLKNGTKYKVSMYTLSTINPRTQKKSKAILMYVRLPDSNNNKSGFFVHPNMTSGYSTHAYSVLIPFGQDNEMEDLASRIVSQEVLKQETGSILGFLDAIEGVDTSSPESLAHFKALKEKLQSSIQPQLDELSSEDREALSTQRKQFEKLIEKIDYTQTTLNAFDVTHVIYSSSSNLIVPIAQVDRIEGLSSSCLRYMWHRTKGAFGKPDYITGLLSAAAQTVVLCGIMLLNQEAMTNLALGFQFSVATFMGVFGLLYRGIMDAAPDDANHSHAKFVTLRTIKDLFITAVTLFTFKALDHKWADVTAGFILTKFFGASLLSKVFGDNIMFIPRMIKDLTGEKYTESLLSGFSLYNGAYQSYYLLTKFIPKKLAELMDDIPLVTGSVLAKLKANDGTIPTLNVGIMTILSLGLLYYYVINPYVMDIVKNQYFSKFIIYLNNDPTIQAKDLDSLTQEFLVALENDSFSNLAKEDGLKFDTVRKYSRQVKSHNRTKRIFKLERTHSKYIPDAIAENRLLIQQEQKKVLEQIRPQIKAILGFMRDNNIHSLDGKLIKKIHADSSFQALMKEFMNLLQEYDMLTVELDTLSKIEANGSSKEIVLGIIEKAAAPIAAHQGCSSLFASQPLF